MRSTLFYISPEQTGRMNRIIDYRTDLYSLGVTFYEMITGIAPFKSEHPLEIIHSHIARKPVSPASHNPEIPSMISHIVMKLLSKNVEDRYQNSFGLMADLNECLKQLYSEGSITPFALAQMDISDKFIIPRKLYGREDEFNTLMSAFNRVNGVTEMGNLDEGCVEVMLVFGTPGIGKSALINEINKPVTEKHGYFISGKYEQFRKDKPYSAIIQAYQKLIRQLLMESNEMILRRKKEILEALGPNGRIITDIIPELEMIIGKQQKVPELSAKEEENRFNLVFEAFAAVFAKKEHPIVLFLDDLQWIDHSSLELIKYLLSGQKINYLFFIGSSRDNIDMEIRPILEIFSEIEKKGISINRLTIKELHQRHIKKFIIDFLNCPEEKVTPLVELIYRKTAGNPFFVNEFLHTLYNEHLIKFDARSGWKWDIGEIKKMQITDNVVELLALKINKLPEDVKDILKLCACVGNRFSLENLSYLQNKNIDEVLKTLTKAIDEGYIGLGDDLYIFHHDRIQEAAYSLIPDDEKPKFHYRIGKLMLEREGEKQNILFYITDHLNLGRSLVTNSKERKKLALLNCKCGIKARTSAAYTPSLKYLETAMSLLAENPWKTQYELCLKIYSEATIVAYLIGNYESMNKYALMVIKNSGTIYDALSVYEIKMDASNSSSNYQEAVTIGLEVMKKINYPIPVQISNLQLLLAMIKIKSAFTIKKINALNDLPDINDPKILTVLRMLSILGRSVYFISQKLFAYIVIKEVELSLKFGHCPVQSYNYMGFAIILRNILGDLEAGYQLGRFALKLGERYNARRYESARLFAFYSFLAHWKEHLKVVRQGFKNAYITGLETGNLEWTSYSLCLHDCIGLLLGYNLNELEQQVSQSYTLIKQFNHIPSLGIQIIIWQTILNLLGKSESPINLTGTALNEKKMIPEWEAAGADNFLGNFYVYRIILRYLFEDYQGALEDCEKMVPYLPSAEGIIMVRDFAFFSALVKIRLYPMALKKRKKEYKKYIAQSIKKFKTWTQQASMNNEHRLSLLLAEEARISGRNKQAEVFYNTAIELSKKNEYAIEEALANELAGRHALDRGKEKLGQIYLSDAYNCYTAWGAAAKLNQLKMKYPELLKTIDFSSPFKTSPLLKNSGTLLDFSTAVKAAQTISGEIVLDKLLSRMMKIVMENAGAQRGFFILEDNGKLVVEAESTITDNDIRVLKSIPVEEHHGISGSIINYIARTKGMLILHDASFEGEFINDPYIKENKPKSILCTAFLSQGKLSGIIYLENNLSTGAFTAERLELLQVLLSQIAISIDNARLYANLEEKVKERTRELKESYTKLKSAKDALWGEMELAKKIQTCLLPDIPHIDGYDISTFIAPAKSVGGDYYDVINTGDRNWIIIGDVSGHGVPAGLVMMMVQTSIHNTLENHPEILPSELIISVNKTITANIKRLGDLKYVTICAFSVKPDGEFIYAGKHLDFAVYRAGTGKIEMFGTSGMWIGFLDDIKEYLKNETFRLENGDTLLLYTDGIIEAFKKGVEKKVMFSKDNLMNLFGSLGKLTTEDIINGIISEVNQDYRINDDITLMVIKKIYK
ncbi:MAG: AAA family ATPase [Spirochaetales bacterium]|nr:AAA family ATPase [Spirochaetales bacterium]